MKANTSDLDLPGLWTVGEFQQLWICTVSAECFLFQQRTSFKVFNWTNRIRSQFWRWNLNPHLGFCKQRVIGKSQMMLQNSLATSIHLPQSVPQFSRHRIIYFLAMFAMNIFESIFKIKISWNHWTWLVFKISRNLALKNWNLMTRMHSTCVTHT
jgi:hypothetical protein